MGKRLNLTNGVSFGGKYTVTASDVGPDGIVEVMKLTVATGATAAGNVGVVVRGATSVPIAVDVDTSTQITFTISTPCTTSGDFGIKLSDALGTINVALLDTDDTPTKVADKIRASILFTGWTIAGTGANVLFTRTAAGPTVGAAGLTVGTTGVDVTAGGITYPALGTLADDTPTKVAIKIAAGTFPGWTVTRSNTIVIFTADAAGAKTGTSSIAPASTGVTGTIAYDPAGSTYDAGFVTFDCRSSDKENLVPYDIVANFTVTTSTGINVPLTGALITYPAEGQVTISEGGAFALAVNQVISVVAQRSVTIV